VFLLHFQLKWFFGILIGFVIILLHLTLNVTSTFSMWGVRGRVVKIVDSKLLALHRCGFKSVQRLWILSCEETIQLAYGTSVVLLRCQFVSEIMHGGAPEVFLHQLSLNVAIWPILCRCDVKTQSKTKTKQKLCSLYQLINITYNTCLTLFLISKWFVHRFFRFRCWFIRNRRLSKSLLHFWVLFHFRLSTPL
jgi:hypothetical protein